MDEIYFCNNLKLVIYTVGYSKEGEAILALIKADDVTRYTIVIDGYKIDEHNIICQLLNEEGIGKLDTFCWSHPDRDHSVGIEDYIPFIKNDTSIIVGDGFYETREKWAVSNEMMYRFIEKELSKSLLKKDRVKIRCVNTGIQLKKMVFRDTRTSIIYPFEMHVFAPNDFLNLRRNMKGVQLVNNDISVGLDLKVGSLVAVFCSDVPNVVFNSITYDDFPEKVDYIKIPHHSSSSSNKVLNLITNKIEVACTTVNTANHLPEDSIIERYKDVANNVFCTNDLSIEEQITTYGIIKTTFVIDRKRRGNNEVEGNAKKVS